MELGFFLFKIRLFLALILNNFLFIFQLKTKLFFAFFSLCAALLVSLQIQNPNTEKQALSKIENNENEALLQKALELQPSHRDLLLELGSFEKAFELDPNY